MILFIKHFGGLVIWLDTKWPDIVVASLVALVFLYTFYVVLREAVRAWHNEPRTAE